jgi:hypothetical protein
MIRIVARDSATSASRMRMMLKSRSSPAGLGLMRSQRKRLTLTRALEVYAANASPASDATS